jgi:hypothetical protein
MIGAADIVVACIFFVRFNGGFIFGDSFCFPHLSIGKKRAVGIPTSIFASVL